MTYKTVSPQVKQMFGEIAPHYDRANTVLSMGIHHIWKRHIIRQVPVKPNMKILDLCCGTGDLVDLLGKRFHTEVTGGDFCEPMLEIARTRFESKPEYKFVQCDALNMQFPDESFDLITVSFGVRNFEDLTKGLAEIRRVLKPGGTLAVLEFGQPRNKIFNSVYSFYARHILPHIGGLLTGNKDAYQYLDETAERFPCDEKFADILRSRGFTVKRVIPYTFGIAYGYIGLKKP